MFHTHTKQQNLAIDMFFKQHTLLKHHVLEQYNCPYQLYGKCKAVPLQAWSGPEGSRKLR